MVCVQMDDKGSVKRECGQVIVWVHSGATV